VSARSARDPGEALGAVGVIEDVFDRKMSAVDGSGRTSLGQLQQKSAIASRRSDDVGELGVPA
jgi:hypothetical protein